MRDNISNFEVGVLTETGYEREENQDHMSWHEVPLGSLFIVADGMGGHKGGALAAKLTDEGLQDFFSQASPDAPVDEVMRNAFHQVNARVYRQAHSGDPATEGTGSTAVLLLISGRNAIVAHVGDSRAYRFHGNRLKLLTRDHTIVQKMLDAGMLKPEEAMDHPNAGVLERAVGSQPDIEVDISRRFKLEQGDIILLCSDGLSGYVTDTEIEDVLRKRLSVQDIPHQLVDLALQKGGKDNITVQVIRYGRRKPQPSETPIKSSQSATPSKSNNSKVHLSVLALASLIILIAVASASAAYYYQSLRLDKMDVELSNASKSFAAKDLQTKTLQKELDNLKKEKQTVDTKVLNYRKLLDTADQNAQIKESSLKDIKAQLQKANSASKELQERNNQLNSDLADSRLRVNKYSSLANANARIIIWLKETSAATKIPSESLVQFARSVGHLYIYWIPSDRALGDLPNDQFPPQNQLYYTRTIEKEMVSKLETYLGQFKPAEYAAEKKPIVDKLSEQFGTKHILLVLSEVVTAPQAPADQSPKPLNEPEPIESLNQRDETIDAD